MSFRILAIDDVREHTDADIVCRTYFEGILAIAKMGRFDVLVLDHDLCAVKKCEAESGRELTGYDVLLWLEDPDNCNLRPDIVRLCTDNPTGLEKMGRALTSMGYIKVNNRHFKKGES